MAKKDFSKVESIKENIGASTAPAAPLPPLKGAPAHDVGVEYMEDAVIVPLDMVVADAQVRVDFDEESIGQLASSIAKHGQQFPITARWDEDRAVYVVIDGERRLRAIRSLKRDTIKVLRRLEKQTEIEVLTAQIVSNDQRENLNPVERAKAYRRFMEATGQNAHLAAKSLGKPASSFAAAIAILDTAPAVIAGVQSGDLSASDALELRKINDPELQEEVAAEIVEKDLNREEAAEAVQEAKARDVDPAPKVKGKRGATRGGKAAKDAKKSKKITEWSPKIDGGIRVSFEARKGLDRETILSAFETLRAKLDADFPLAATG